MTIAVTGATGQLGQLVIGHLRKRVAAKDIVALVRSLNKASDLGVHARAFDYTTPDMLAPALTGVDTLLLISSDAIGQRTAQHRNVIAAAKQAGVGRIAYTSVLHADRSPLSLAAEHRETEEALAKSGLPTTLLRNGWYTENYLASVPAALANGVFVGSAGDGRLSLATRNDYAEVAAVVLTGDGHEGRTYELAGDDAVTLSELAAALSRQVGCPIPYRDLPQAEFAAILKEAGMPKAFAEGLASWDVGASHGVLFDDGRALSRLIGRPTTPLAAVIAASLDRD